MLLLKELLKLKWLRSHKNVIGLPPPTDLYTFLRISVSSSDMSYFSLKTRLFIPHYKYHCGINSWTRNRTRRVCPQYKQTKKKLLARKSNSFSWQYMCCVTRVFNSSIIVFPVSSYEIFFRIRIHGFQLCWEQTAVVLPSVGTKKEGIQHQKIWQCACDRYKPTSACRKHLQYLLCQLSLQHFAHTTHVHTLCNRFWINLPAPH